MTAAPLTSPSPRGVDFARHRDRFPVLDERIYLATQCMGPFPAEGYRDLVEYAQSRALHSRALDIWFERIEEVTGLIEALLGAPAGSVALRGSATACQAAIAASVTPAPGRDRIVVTSLDFHSSLHLWRAQEQRGFRVTEVASDDGISVRGEAVASAIDERVAVVAVSLVSRNSALLDVAPVIRAARAAGAIVVLDAYQAVGALPIDVLSLGVDVLVGGTLKWLCGETGLGFMYVAPALADRLTPAYPGWFGHQDLPAFVHTHAFVDRYAPSPGARRFQQGTPAMGPIYGARAGLRFALEVGVEAIRARNGELSEHLARGAIARGIGLLCPRPGDQRVGGVCLDVPDPESTVRSLEALGIDVDQRRRMMIRAAPHPCVTLEECDRFLEALADITSRQQR